MLDVKRAKFEDGIDRFIKKERVKGGATLEPDAFFGHLLGRLRKIGDTPIPYTPLYGHFKAGDDDHP